MVFISGVILTFLSINNITNFRILTEKRIQETQLEIAARISENFNQALQKVTEEFSREWPSRKMEYPADSLFLRLQEIPVQPFLVKPNGDFAFPWFMETGQIIQPKISGKVQQDVTNGETDEFQREDFPKALTHYTSALHGSKTSADSARVISVLGRVTSKMKQPEKTWIYYASLFPQLSGELSPGGVPYSYFAVSRLIKLSISAKHEETLRIITLFLEQLNNGEVPLNSGTKILLDEISAWKSTVSTSEIEKKRLNKLSESIISKLDFVDNYGLKIREIVSSGRQSELPPIAESFSVYNTGSSEKPELIIINTKSGNPKGFKISLKDAWNSSISGLPFEDKSGHFIELVNSGNNQLSPDGLTIRAELSPYFPLQRIVIKPANEKIVENFVRNRSWIYGIALVLLLGVMSLGIYLILRDINREKKIADMQSEFVSHVTHELKTPLTSINMFAETIFFERAKTPESRKKYANIIMKESEVLKRKIDNILLYSVRKNETSKYRIREIDLSVLVDEVMEEMKYWLDINHFKVSVEKEENITADADADAIKQALSNLIGNAIKYSADRKQLIVRLYRKENVISLEVEDKGIGIPKDQVDLIFEKFYRVKGLENESATGTGLGLSVTRDIVNAHGGKIFVESEINKGSKFTIQLNS